MLEKFRICLVFILTADTGDSIQKMALVVLVHDFTTFPISVIVRLGKGPFEQ